MKIIALAETHYVGMIPHFTSPIGEAALVHCLTATSIPALMEMLGDGSRTFPYLPKVYDFRDGKMWPNERPGLGVEVDVCKLTKIGEYTKYNVGHAAKPQAGRLLLAVVGERGRFQPPNGIVMPRRSPTARALSSAGSRPGLRTYCTSGCSESQPVMGRR